MTEYLLVSRVGSESTPGTLHDVKTDGKQLTCACAGWTRRVHYAACQAVVSGQSCNCNTLALRGNQGERTLRTCRHVRHVAREVAALGGFQTVMRMLRSGVDLEIGEASVSDPQWSGPRTPEPVTIQQEPWFVNLTVGVRELVQEHASRQTKMHLLVAIDEAARRLQAAPVGVRPATIPRASARPSWLGGARAILLRD
jgi:hypothetical protein